VKSKSPPYPHITYEKVIFNPKKKNPYPYIKHILKKSLAFIKVTFRLWYIKTSLVGIEYIHTLNYIRPHETLFTCMLTVQSFYYTWQRNAHLNLYL